MLGRLPRSVEAEPDIGACDDSSLAVELNRCWETRGLAGKLKMARQSWWRAHCDVR